MVQTATQNSALSQNWVGCTGTHPTDPSCTHGAPRPRARHRVMVRVGLYRGSHKIVSWPPPSRVVGVPCRVDVRTCALVRCVAKRLPFAPGHNTKLYRDPIHAALALRVVSRRVVRAKRRIMAHPASYRSLYCCPYYETISAPSHDTIFLSQLSPPAARPSGTHAARFTRRPSVS